MSRLFVPRAFSRVALLILGNLLAILLVPRLGTLWAAPPASVPPFPAQAAQSIERSRMDMGMSPNDRESNPNHKANPAKAKAKFEEMKGDIATLADLVNSVRVDLSKASPDQLPPTLTEKLDQISKLSKRIEKLNGGM